MKKIIKAITLFLIIVVFGEVSYAAEYLNSVEFNEKYMNNTLPRIFTKVVANISSPIVFKITQNITYWEL